jgi:hypothetical protein
LLRVDDEEGGNVSSALRVFCNGVGTVAVLVISAHKQGDSFNAIAKQISRQGQILLLVMITY